VIAAAFIVTVILVVAVAVSIIWLVDRHQRKRGPGYTVPEGLDMELPPIEEPFIGGWNEFKTIWTAPDGRRFTKQRYAESMQK
jgi:hypothetical protein